MRTETEMFDLIQAKAARLRRTRRHRWVVAMSAVGCLAAVVFAVGTSQRTHGTTVLVAAPAAVTNDDNIVRSTGPPGAVLGYLEIPAIGLQRLIVEGVSVDALKLGPGHYEGTPLPGHDGNAAIAGHRLSDGGAFRRLDELRVGDRIEVTTLEGVFVYLVVDSVVVDPDAVEVLAADRWSGHGSSATLTLTSEHPASSARERLVVGAVLVGDPVR